MGPAKPAEEWTPEDWLAGIDDAATVQPVEHGPEDRYEPDSPGFHESVMDAYAHRVAAHQDADRYIDPDDHERELFDRIDHDRVRDAITVPADAGEWADGLRQVLRRVADGYDRNIWCGPGWYPIIVHLDQALASIDSDYLVYQVKEKFGGLRYHYATMVDAEAKVEILRLVAEAEYRAWRTCENTGRPGILMVRGGSWYKTLDPHTALGDYELAPPGVINGIWPPPPPSAPRGNLLKAPQGGARGWRSG